jgi:hypothetical protein
MCLDWKTFIKRTRDVSKMVIYDVSVKEALFKGDESTNVA